MYSLSLQEGAWGRSCAYLRSTGGGFQDKEIFTLSKLDTLIISYYYEYQCSCSSFTSLQSLKMLLPAGLKIYFVDRLSERKRIRETKREIGFACRSKTTTAITVKTNR